MYTETFRNPALLAMRALVSSVLDRIEFRHHGIGVLQGYVREHTEPEIRVHIWSRRLLKPGMDVSGDIHDHRFDMVSHVLCGEVLHEEILETSDPIGTHAMMALTHARAAAGTDYHGPTTQLEGRYSIEKHFFRIQGGSSYCFPAGVFHHSPLPLSSDEDAVSVTVVEKHNQGDFAARILYPATHEPVMAFGHKPDKELIREIVSIAARRLK